MELRRLELVELGTVTQAMRYAALRCEALEDAHVGLRLRCSVTLSLGCCPWGLLACYKHTNCARACAFVCSPRRGSGGDVTVNHGRERHSVPESMNLKSTLVCVFEIYLVSFLGGAFKVMEK